jgi:hypothetical protein
MNVFTGIFALVIAFTALWFSIKFLRYYSRVRKWDRVSARIIASGTSLHKRYSSRNTPYKVDASYQYNYKGKEFENDKVYLVELLGGQANHMKEAAEKKAAKIKGDMSIYVDPADPAHSVIYCNGLALYWVAFLMGLFSLIFGITRFV